MTEPDPQSVGSNAASESLTQLTPRAGRSPIVKASGILLLSMLVIGGCFFVGRRIYYRLIQPAPLWSVPTPKTEQVVCDSSLAIQLWADESLVHNPTSLSVDARGRVWVSEAVNYRDWQNHQRQAGKVYQDAGDCIVILEDTDGDGRADSRKVFVQDPDLISPTGICVLGNRVFVSCSPSIFVYIDDDGDDRAERREVLLTGFGGHDHDHGVHSIVPGPDGRLYFAVGNAGPHIVTDKNGWTLRAGSLHQWIPENSGTPEQPSAKVTLNSGGLVSDDGRVYVGGLVLSVEPDGSNLQVHSHNARNPYEICVDSFGDVWQTDNDDTASCRMTWLMKGSSTGFTSADGNRSWQADQRPGQQTQTAHWHQDDPGVLPAGDVYGTGAPTGLVRYEGNDLGSSLQGAILACDAGLGCVFAFQPVPQGAGFTFHRKKIVWSELLTDEKTQRPDGLALTWFRPTDIAIAPGGHLFLADWYDSYVGAHRVNDFDGDGRIYIIRRQETVDPDAEFSVNSEAGPNQRGPDRDQSLNGFRSSVPELRWAARQQLLADPEQSEPLLRDLMESSNESLKARAIFILARMGEAAKADIRAQLRAADPQIRIAALRALLSAGDPAVTSVTAAIVDPEPALRREAAIALRGLPLDDCRSLLIQLAARIGGDDRFAVEAFGSSSEGHAEQIYPELRLRLGADPLNWTPGFSMLTWRLHPVAALEDLQERLNDNRLSPSQRRQLIDTIAFVPDPRGADLLASLISKSPPGDSDAQAAYVELTQYAAWWKSRLEEKQSRSSASSPNTTTRLPVRYQPAVQRAVDSRRIEDISAMSGSADRGRELFHSKQGTCGNCHRVANVGGDIGPDLTHIAARLTRPQLVEAILYPSNSVLTGYESWTIVDSQGRTFSGLLESAGNDIVLRNADAARITIAQTEIEELIRQGSSIMPDVLSASFSDQQLADLVEFLISLHH